MSETTPRTAQDAWRELLRDHLGPELRRMGWKGSGSNWEIPDEVSFAQMGFQKSRGSNREEISFTINLSVISRSEWEQQRARWGDRAPERPSAGVRYGFEGWNSRIGHLLPDNRDTWWSITPESDVAEMGARLARSITEHATPHLHREIWVRAELAAGREVEPELLVRTGL